MIHRSTTLLRRGIPMISEKFRSAFLAHEVARANYTKSCIEIWHVFHEDEPELAAQILEFGWDEMTTAVWFSKSAPNSPSLASTYTSSNRSEVADRMLRLAHGFLG